MNHFSRSHLTPLTNDRLMSFAPSIFAQHPWHAMSEKYRFIPTINVVEGMRQNGFLPVFAHQSMSRIEGKGNFTKHVINFRDFRNGDAPAIRALGQIYPEIVVTNSHDGVSAYIMNAGLWRLVCLNGAVVSMGNLGMYRSKHSGKVDAQNVIDASFEIVEQFPRVLESVEQWNQLRLNPPQQKAFAEAALTLKYDENPPVTPDQILRPRRQEDRDDTLWNTFNRVQESLTQGGNRYYREAHVDETTNRYVSARRQTTRPVNSVGENLKLNKALWQLADKMKDLVS